MQSSNNAADQNKAAGQQIQGNTAAAQAALANYLKSNPSILAQAPQSINAPQQMGGVQGGGHFGGPTGGAMGAGAQHVQPLGAPPNQQAMSGRPPQAAPQAPGAPAGGPPQPNIPPGLLGLLRPQ